MSVLEDLGAALGQSIIVGSMPRSGYPPGGRVKTSSNPAETAWTPLFRNMCIFGQKRCSIFFEQNWSDPMLKVECHAP
jgi:hypothetical protein